MHPTFVETQRAFLCKGQCVWTNGIPRIFAASAPASAGFQCILGSRAPLLWQGVSPGPVGSRNLHRLLGLLCAQLTASGCAGDGVGQSLASARLKEGLPGGRGWDSPSLGSPCEQPSCGKLTETRLRPLWSRSQLALLRSVSGPSKSPVQEGNPTSSAYAWGEGLWVSSFSSLESLDFFHWL